MKRAASPVSAAEKERNLEEADFPLGRCFGHRRDRRVRRRRPSLGRRWRQRHRIDREHGPDQARRENPQVRRPEDHHRGRRPDDHQQDECQKGRPPHVLAGDRVRTAADQEGAEALLHPETHLQSDRRLARCQGQWPTDQEPRRGGQKGLGHRGQPDEEGRLLVHRPEAERHLHGAGHGRHLERPARRSTSSARSTPGCMGRSKFCPDGG